LLFKQSSLDKIARKEVTLAFHDGVERNVNPTLDRVLLDGTSLDANPTASRLFGQDVERLRTLTCDDVLETSLRFCFS